MSDVTYLRPIDAEGLEKFAAAGRENPERRGTNKVHTVSVGKFRTISYLTNPDPCHPGVVGKSIDSVQKTFKSIYDLSSQFKTDASQFDILTEDGSTLSLGSLIITAMHMPGHTPADMVYWVDDGQRKAVFVGDTLFAPDVGTARCDFPNGSSSDLYDSIQRLLSLPDDTLLYLCHDYPPKNGRQHTPTTTVADEKQRNIHVKHGTSKAEFIQMRETRDKDLPMPRLILPSVQVNINAGELPNAHANGIKYLSIPLNQF